MGAELRLVCTSRGESYFGDTNNCVYIDEIDCGIPKTDFSKLVYAYDEQKITYEFIEKVKLWAEFLDVNKKLDIAKLIHWLEDHVGEPLEFEAW